MFLHCRLLFEAVETAMVRACALAQSTDSPAGDFVQQQCAHLLFLIIYLLESGLLSSDCCKLKD
jgi:hypothetical protein